MPVEQALAGQGLFIALGGVQHHLDHAVDVAVRRRRGGDVQAQAAGDGGADLVLVQHLALDLAGPEDVLGQGGQHGLGAQVEAQTLHPAEQPALPMAHGGQAVGERVHAPLEPGPGVLLMNVLGHSLHLLRRIWATIAAGAITA